MSLVMKQIIITVHQARVCNLSESIPWSCVASFTSGISPLTRGVCCQHNELVFSSQILNADNNIQIEEKADNIFLTKEEGFLKVK